jgi:predicted dehydrogenase
MSASCPRARRARVTRRQFVGCSTALGIASISCPNILQARSPGEKLRIAIIGCGGRGGANMQEMRGETIVALCDVDENALSRATKIAPRAQTFRDFRKLYDALRDDQFDAVVVSTTEHTHAAATLPALQRKKHVYCEKPLTHNVREARVITEAAKRAGVATQMGTQIHASNNYRRVVEAVRSGAVGPVREVHVWVSRAWGWQTQQEAKRNKDIVWTIERPTESTPVPRWLDWDLWLGPAPSRPFHEVYVPGPKWYRWWDFGNGTMSDLGSHWNDLPWWALKLEAPLTVEAHGPPPHPELAPASMSVTYEFGPRGELPPVTLTWYQGTQKPPQWQSGQIPRWDNGVLFVGSQGLLLADYAKLLLLPEQQFRDYRPPAKTIPDSIGHHAEWIRACKTGEPTLSHFGYSGPLTESNHLGNVAFRAGKRIAWDSRNLRIPNAPEAETLLGREYRAGWSLT